MTRPTRLPRTWGCCSRLRIPTASANAGPAQPGSCSATGWEPFSRKRTPWGGSRTSLRRSSTGSRGRAGSISARPWLSSDLEREFGDQVSSDETVLWDERADAVVARRAQRLGAIVLRESSIRDPDHDLVAQALLDRIRQAGLGALPWSETAQRMRARIAFARTLDAGWPDVSHAALLEALTEWLGPAVRGIRRWNELERLDLAHLLLSRLSWQQRAAIDILAPSHLQVPSGSRIAIDYGDPAAPVLAVRLQEIFGWTETPRIGGGPVALTLHLLSPAGRPVQVTRDLAGFWRTTYFEVRKDLKGRYPKHRWPDDPLQASASRRRK